MFLILGGIFAFRSLGFVEGASNRFNIFGAPTAQFRGFLWMTLSLVLAEGIRTSKERFAAEATLKTIGGLLMGLGTLLLFASSIWKDPTGQFAQGTPAWLGNKDLVIPALIFWGFPWINTVGVLIYLAGLQQIPVDVYEAAELDGIGPWGMLFRIELPLILTQVRINLIFMTIGTLTTYEMFLILLGPNGGPDNRGMVPGLYMFSKAFLEGKFGYACALGMVLFVMILGLTVIYNKYVKIEK
jgi:ABC-type sugar transport system permease subunit